MGRSVAGDTSTDVHARIAGSWGGWRALGALAPDGRLNKTAVRSLAPKVVCSVQLLAGL